MLRITIEADTRQDMLNHLVEWVAVLSGQQGVDSPTPPTCGTEEQPMTDPRQLSIPFAVDNTEPKKRGRRLFIGIPRKDEAKPEPEPEPKREAKTEPAAPVDPMAAVNTVPKECLIRITKAEAPVEIPTHEATIAALMKVAAVRSGDIGPTTGYERVAKILQAHGLTNVKGIKEAHRASIIAACVSA